MAKKIPRQTLTGRLGVNHIERHILEMGFSWNPTTIDAGIDGYIEIRDQNTGAAQNLVISDDVAVFCHLNHRKLPHIGCVSPLRLR